MGRLLSSLEEIDALPVGSVIMEGTSGAPVPLRSEWFDAPGVTVMPTVFHRFADGGWYVVAGHGARDIADEVRRGQIRMPMTLLHVPSVGDLDDVIRLSWALAKEDLHDFMTGDTWQGSPDPDDEQAMAWALEDFQVAAWPRADRYARILSGQEQS